MKQLAAIAVHTIAASGVSVKKTSLSGRKARKCSSSSPTAIEAEVTSTPPAT